MVSLFGVPSLEMGLKQESCEGFYSRLEMLHTPMAMNKILIICSMLIRLSWGISVVKLSEEVEVGKASSPYHGAHRGLAIRL